MVDLLVVRNDPRYEKQVERRRLKCLNCWMLDGTLAVGPILGHFGLSLVNLSHPFLAGRLSRSLVLNITARLSVFGN